MSYTASLIDGTTVEIVDKVVEGQKTLLVDAEGSRYVASLHGDYVTPVTVAEAVAEVEAAEAPLVSEELIAERREEAEREESKLEEDIQPLEDPEPTEETEES